MSNELKLIFAAAFLHAVPAIAQEPKLLKRVDPEYPQIAKQVGATGRVELMVTIAPEGNVTAVKVVAGHPMLQNAAVQAVKQWTYSVLPVESAVAVTVNFPGDDALQPGQRSIQQAVLINRTEPNYPSELRNAGIGGSVALTAVIGTDGHVKSVRALRGDPQLVPLANDAVLQWFYKPTMLDGRPVETETNIIVSFTPATASASARVFDERIQKLRDLSELQQPELISRKEPVRQAIGGTVNFRATVGIDGRLSNIRVTDAPAELVAAALDAVKQWVYRPAKLNGAPVEAETQISLRFAAGH